MFRLCIAALAVIALIGSASAQRPPPPEPVDFPFGFLEIADDPRFDEERIYTRIALRPLGRAFAGVEVALGEAEGIMRFMPEPTNFRPVRYEATDVDDAVATVERWVADEGIQVLGGHGFIREHPVEMWFRNARTLSVLEGTLAL